VCVCVCVCVCIYIYIYIYIYAPKPGNGVLGLCLLDNRMQSKALAVGILCHTDSVN
jgi:hypothetical protein